VAGDATSGNSSHSADGSAVSISSSIDFSEAESIKGGSTEAVTNEVVSF